MKDRTSPLFILVAILATVAALIFAKAILLPIALSILLTFLLTPLADRLERWRIPRVPAVLSVVLLTFALIGGLGWIVTKQVIDLSLQLPDHKRTLIGKIEAIKPDSPTWARVANALSDVRTALTTGAAKKGPEQPPSPAPQSTDDASQPTAPIVKPESKTDGPLETAEKFANAAVTGEVPTSKDEDKTVAVNVIELPPSPLTQIQGWLGPLLVAPVTMGGLVVVLVLFMLLDRENQRSRLVQLFGRAHMHAAAEAMHDAAGRVGRYLRMLFLVNAGYGLAVGLGLWAIGIPGAAMWGVLGFSLRFLPYIGPWIAAILPIMVSVATTATWTQPMLVIGWYLIVELISNNVVEPLVYGNTTGVSTVGVIFAAIFWTWLWGPIGLILAMPMTVCLLVAARYIPQLRFLTILLADRPPLSAAERVYQRLLAFDYREPLKLARKQLKDGPLVAYYDEVLIPALVMAEQDRLGDLLNDEQATFVMEATEDMVDELGEADRQNQAEVRADEAADAKAAGRDVTSGTAIRPARVLCIPLRDEADEIACRMLTQLLRADGFQADAGTITSLTNEMVDRVADSDSDIVVISVLPPIAPRDSRLLWKKLRGRYPNLPIVVGFWTAEKDKEALAEPVEDSASKVVTTLAEAITAVRGMAAQVTLAAKTA